MSTLILEIQNAASSHQAAIERMGWTLIHFVWQATAVALLLAVVLYALRKAAPNVRYVVSCLSLILIVALPIVTMQLVAVDGPAAEAGPPLPAPDVAESATASVVEVAELPPITFEAVPLEVTASTPHVSWRERFVATLERSLPYLVLGWLTGVFGLSVWHLGGWSQLQRMKRRYVQPVAASLQAKLANLAGQLGIRRAVTLVESALVEVPTVVGWIKPVVLLPASALNGLSLEQLEAILAHELAHIRRHDYLVNVLQTFVEILGFYHPALWWISQRIRDERENCCDDLAVTVCGDSLRYAKALTYLEEMRHRGAEIAIAATGGSLVSRIGRLIGRPVNERRLTWMPGLVALLLVAGILVPTALVLGGQPRQDATLAADQDASPDFFVTDHIPRTQVLLRFAVVDVFGDRVADTQTAETLQGLLTRVQLPGEPTGPAPQPSLAELRAPLRSVFGRFAPGLDKGKELVDLLVDNGYARILGRPMILTFENQPGTITFGDVTYDGAVPGNEWSGEGMGVTAVAHVVNEQGDVILSIDYYQKHRVGDPQDANAPMSVSQASTSIVLARGQHAAIVTSGPGGIQNSPQMLLVGPVEVYPPQMNVRVGARGGSRRQSVRSEQGRGPQVMIEAHLAKVQAEATVNRETREAVAELLGVDSIQTATLGQILGQHVVGKSLASATVEALLELLETRGYLEIEGKPRLLVNNNQQGEIKAVAEEPVLDRPNSAAPPRHVEIGTVMRLTPHVPADFQDRLIVEFGLEWSRKDPQFGSNLPTIRHTEVVTTATTMDGRSFTILVEPGQEEGTDNSDTEALMIVLTPTVIERDSTSPSVTAAPAPSGQTDQRQVLLGVQTISMPHAELLNLPFEWALPQPMDGLFSPPTNSAAVRQFSAGYTMGYTPRATDAESIAAAVDHLRGQGKATVLSRQQIMTASGTEARYNVTAEQLFVSTDNEASTSAARIESIALGQVLTVVPRIADNDQILLEIQFESSEAAPQDNDGASLPHVNRRRSAGKIVIPSGGTLALAGLTGVRGQQDGDIAVLVTARIAEEVDSAGDSARVSPQALARTQQYADAGIHSLQERLAQTEAELAKARQTMTENHPRVVRLKSEIESLNRRIAEIQRDLSHDPVSLARGQYLAGDPRLRVLDEEISAIKIELAQELRTDNHPQVIAKREHLAALETRANEIRAELEQEFESMPARQRSAADQPRGTFNWLVNADEMMPLDYLTQLRTADATVAEVFGYEPGWVKEQDVPRLFKMIDSAQPCPCPMPGPVSPITGVSSTIGREAALLIRSFWTGRYPASYREVVSDEAKEALRRQWQQYREIQGATASLDSESEPASERSAIAIETRLVSVGDAFLASVGDAFLDVILQGSSTQETASSDDLDTQRRIAEHLRPTHPLVLNDAQRTLLLRLVQNQPDAKVIAAPRVTVLPGEEAHLNLGTELGYIAGYTAPPAGSFEPTPQVKREMVGIEVAMTAGAPAGGRIELNAKIALSNVAGYSEKTYQSIRYSVPQIDRDEIALENLAIPEGQTILIGWETAIPLETDAETDTPRRLLILLKAREASIEPGRQGYMGGLPGNFPPIGG